MNVPTIDRVQRSFSRSFSSYHDRASQQAKIAEHLLQEMRASGTPQNFASALEFGCGTGHLTHRINTAFEFAQFAVNDLSPEAAKTARDVGAEFLCGDAEAVQWPDQPDLIVSASMIQWLNDPLEFLRRVAHALASGGWLAVSGFGPDQYRELANVGSAAQAPGLCTADEMAGAIDSLMEIMSCGERVSTLHFASPKKVLRHLRDTGVNGRAQKVWTKSSLAEFSEQYVMRFGTEKGVPLTYNPTWIIAHKRR